MTEQVQVRTLCDNCNGTAHRPEMGKKQAKEKYDKYLKGERTPDGEPNYRTEEEFRKCRECLDGYNYIYLSLDELGVKLKEK